MYELLKKLCAVHGVSGREGSVSDFLKQTVIPYADEIGCDALGNLIAVRHGTSKTPKKVMLCAHMDEIGFFVTYIEDSGILRIAPVGGIHFVAAAYSEVVSERGVHGVLCQDEDADKKFTFDKFFIDIGAADRRDAEKKVRVGDFFVQTPSLTRLMHRRVAGRPLDDRLGCAILVEVAKRLHETGCPDDVYYVFSVQEEVGCRGAKTAAAGILPDEAIVYDVTGTGDKPGDKPMACKLGGGAAVKLKDSSVICDIGLADMLADTAKANRIPYQYEILTYGGTDTSSIQVTGCGCRAAALSIPCRYIHSGTEVCDLSDAQACVDLTVAYLTR